MDEEILERIASHDGMALQSVAVDEEEEMSVREDLQREILQQEKRPATTGALKVLKAV